MTELTRISSKGQLVIPFRIRDQLNINEGSIMAIDITKNLIIIKKVDVDLVNQFKKSLSDVKAGKIRRVA